MTLHADGRAVNGESHGGRTEEEDGMSDSMRRRLAALTDRYGRNAVLSAARAVLR